MPFSNRLLVATSNPGKFREITDFLKDLSWQTVSLRDLGIIADCEENGATFEENALIKAKYYYSKSGSLTLAEDSGILVDALVGELGVKTRRWGKGEKASDEEWIEYFLQVMKDVPEEKRTARFICCAAVTTAKEQKIFKGETRGIITSGLEAPLNPGLALSSCFKPFGSAKVYAALSSKEKNVLSHRGKALRQVEEFIGKIQI